VKTKQIGRRNIDWYSLAKYSFITMSLLGLIPLCYFGFKWYFAQPPPPPPPPPRVLTKPAVQQPTAHAPQQAKYESINDMLKKMK